MNEMELLNESTNFVCETKTVQPKNAANRNVKIAEFESDTNWHGHCF